MLVHVVSHNGTEPLDSLDNTTMTYMAYYANSITKTAFNNIHVPNTEHTYTHVDISNMCVAARQPEKHPNQHPCTDSAGYIHDVDPM